MKKSSLLVGALAVVICGLGYFALKDNGSGTRLALEEESDVKPVEKKEATDSKAVTNVTAGAGTERSQKSASAISEIHRIAAEFRSDEITKWSQQLKRAGSKEEAAVLVREGLRGFKSLDSSSKALFRMSFCGALMNREEPEAIKFIENTAKMNANNPNVIANLLKSLNQEGALARYPELTRTAVQWFSANKDIRYEVGVREFKSDDPKVMKAIEGSKFVTFEVDQIQTQLARINAI